MNWGERRQTLANKVKTISTMLDTHKVCVYENYHSDLLLCRKCCTASLTRAGVRRNRGPSGLWGSACSCIFKHFAIVEWASRCHVELESSNLKKNMWCKATGVDLHISTSYQTQPLTFKWNSHNKTVNLVPNEQSRNSITLKQENSQMVKSRQMDFLSFVLEVVSPSI